MLMFKSRQKAIVVYTSMISVENYYLQTFYLDKIQIIIHIYIYLDTDKDTYILNLSRLDEDNVTFI